MRFGEFVKRIHKLTGESPNILVYFYIHIYLCVRRTVANFIAPFIIHLLPTPLWDYYLDRSQDITSYLLENAISNHCHRSRLKSVVKWSILASAYIFSPCVQQLCCVWPKVHLIIIAPDKYSLSFDLLVCTSNDERSELAFQIFIEKCLFVTTESQPVFTGPAGPRRSSLLPRNAGECGLKKFM